MESMQSLRRKHEEKATLGADCHCLKDMAGLQALLSKGYFLAIPKGGLYISAGPKQICSV